jgi:glycosyltransferase involved in cell wall biosynthesis
MGNPIIYILEATSICGGVKVVFEQARELKKRGLDIKIVSKGPYPAWLDFTVPFKQITCIEETFKEDAIFILTFFNHILIAKALGVLDKCIHLCQGYEGDCEEAKPFLKEIEQAYKIPILRITVSPRLARYLHLKFGINAFSVGQAIDHSIFYPAKQPNLSPPFKILIMGSFTNSVKRVKDALAAATLVKNKLPVRLIRISLSETKKEEMRLYPIDEYYQYLKPQQVADIMRTAHALIMSSGPGEGFGLPVIEAMACGLPVIMTNIDSFKEITKNKYPLPLIPVGDVNAMASLLLKLLTDANLFLNARKTGIELASAYTYDKVGEKLVNLLKKRMGIKNSWWSQFMMIFPKWQTNKT